jgi:hypothetical protein
MKKIILSVTLCSLYTILTAIPAMAHIEVGTHSGQTADGKTCSFIAGEQTFENGLRHPLNERIKINIDGEDFNIQHPATIDLEKGVTYFNHDQFQAVQPTTKGSKALVIKMVHSKEFEGPSEFTLINSEWKSGQNQVIQCTGLKHQK